MSDLFVDRLIDAALKHQAPICAGMDPNIDLLPGKLTAKVAQHPHDMRVRVDAIFDFISKVLHIVSPHVPCVKFQSAYFEQYRWDGVESYYSLIKEAKDLGLVVIGDVKRGDIGTTAAAYADGHLKDWQDDEQEDVAAPDAITINPMLGMDTIEPFIKSAASFQKGLFVLVRTSNPGSAQLQDVALADGRSWSQMLADELAKIAARPELIGHHGYSSIGAVVGATQPQTMQSLRERLPQSIFLLPGYGAQGATADMTRAAFKDGKGALISASRSVLYAHRKPEYQSKFGDNWEQCVEQAVLDMKEDVRRVLGH